MWWQLGIVVVAGLGAHIFCWLHRPKIEPCTCGCEQDELPGATELSDSQARYDRLGRVVSSEQIGTVLYLPTATAAEGSDGADDGGGEARPAT